MSASEIDILMAVTGRDLYFASAEDQVSSPPGTLGSTAALEAWYSWWLLG
jgi:hypothetical protein